MVVISFVLILTAISFTGYDNKKMETTTELPVEEVQEEVEAKQEKTMKELLQESGGIDSEGFAAWVEESIKILEGEWNDPRLEEANFDEGFEYYLKSEKIRELQSEMIGRTVAFETESEFEKKLDQDLQNFFLLGSILNHVQFSRTSHLGENGEAKEATELADQWRATPEEMRQANEYMKQWFHDMDVAINHNGEGETYGVTNILDGENERDLRINEYWNGG